jgi:hypothetical protein
MSLYSCGRTDHHPCSSHCQSHTATTPMSTSLKWDEPLREAEMKRLEIDSWRLEWLRHELKCLGIKTSLRGHTPKTWRVSKED